MSYAYAESASQPDAGPSPFIYEALTQRVVFGAGRLAEIGSEAAQLGFKRPLIISTPGRRALAERAATHLGVDDAHIFADAAMHAPEETVAAAMARVSALKADGLISCGGGSAIGIAKAVSVSLRMHILALATTYSGSEATARWSVTKDGAKEGGIDPVVLPRSVIYDPELSLSLPIATSAASGLNTMSHAIAALFRDETPPAHQLLAVDGLRRLAGALPRIKADSSDIAARGDALIGSHMCGTVLPTTLGVHTKSAHVLGGAFGLPHAQTHAALLPHTTAYYAAAAPRAAQTIADAIQASDAGAGLFALLKSSGAPAALKDLGLARGDLTKAADLIAAAPIAGPRPVEVGAIGKMLNRAFDGVDPQ